MNIKKRDGSLMPFNSKKITAAILKALTAVGMPSESVAAKVTKDVLALIVPDSVPTVEAVQDLVETALMKRGLSAAAKAYILYRDEHSRARKQLRVRKPANTKQSITDQSMLIVQDIDADGRDTSAPWNRDQIISDLVHKANMDEGSAHAVAKQAEETLIQSGLTTVKAAFVRELVNSILLNNGYAQHLDDSENYLVPKTYVTGLLSTKNNENSNIKSNNPEAVSLAISDIVLRQFALDKVYNAEVAKNHKAGRIYVHDNSLPVRVYCSSHSIEYIKKYGLRGLNNLDNTSKPAKSASVLTGHLNTFLASMQACYAGALGLGFVNIFYAPMLVGFSKKQLKQTAQELIFNMSQNAFSRGSQTIFSDLNLHSGIPSYMLDIPAISFGGRYYIAPVKTLKDASTWEALDEKTVDGVWGLYRGDKCQLHEENGKFVYTEDEGCKVLVYGDFKEEVAGMAHAMLDVWGEGDADGHLFAFPKCDFHVSAETFTDPDQRKVYDHACRVAAKNGSTYFVFDRDSVSLASCCRLKVQITDMSLLKHPERLRTCGLQNVTINIPQAAYRANKAGKPTLEGLLEQIDAAMALAVQAHLDKKAFAERMMQPGGPLWQLGKVANDGRPYLDTKDATYIIGLIGVNDAVQYLTGEQLHESQAALDMGLAITGHMYLRCKDYTKQYGLTFKLEESPAESAARKLAKTDLVYWRDDALKVYKGGDEDHAYYTNSIHITADAPIDLVERINKQSYFNPMIEAGAIIHAFIGEEQPSSEVIAETVRRTFQDTQAAQITFSPEFTYCTVCGHDQRGIHEYCEKCGSFDVFAETRIVGYFARLSGWNASKLAELRARHNGDYAVAKSFDKEECHE